MSTYENSHQITLLRSFIAKDGEKITYDKLTLTNKKIYSLKDLYTNHKEIVELIPEKERYNIFYTVGLCAVDKRDFRRLNEIFFDIDEINLPELIFNNKLKDIHQAAAKILRIEKDEITMITSGNGIHLVTGLAEPITSPKTFKELKPHYNAVCKLLEKELASIGITAKIDPVVFEPKRILRMPGTENRKVGKKSTLSMLQFLGNMSPLIDLKSLSGITVAEPEDSIDLSLLKRYPMDEESIMDKCLFMKYLSGDKSKVTEPQWYAGLSIAGRFESKDAVRQISRNPSEGVEKAIQAVEASPPRTCVSISALWGDNSQCGDCPYWGKIKSPVSIKGESFIPTAGTGFHTIPFNDKGKPLKPIPNYDDLLAFFKQETHYVHDKRGSVYVWKETHYEEITKYEIEGFAQEHFKPSATSRMTQEFRQRVMREEFIDDDFFGKVAQGFINFRNGVLELKTMSFFKHSPDFPFRYCLDFDYDPEAESPLYDKMLEKVACGDSGIMMTLDEAGGYAISGLDYFIHKAPVLVGGGSNGKSTWISTLGLVAGKGNYSNLTISDLNKSEYNRKLIDGKLYNISEETPTTALLDSSMFKRLVGGGIIQSRQIYGTSYEIVNRAKIIMTCNELPPSVDRSEGLLRRLLVIPFDAKFSKDDEDFDPHILDKLKEERSGIFNRFARGLQRLVEKKEFTGSTKIDRAISEYAEDIDPMKVWIKENTIATSSVEDKITTSDLYASYAASMESDGVEPATKTMLTRTINKFYGESIWFTRWRADGGIVKGFKKIRFEMGIGLELEDEDADEIPV